ncbi:unnamed protein product [Durusdinium trenchii]|uniref:Pentatricopeptide repeat-containing protein, chloroplastic n=1 Tax=Durusdinium trenchii TaxID=1381693 RepID=A0ABP0JTW3_9DINO
MIQSRTNPNIIAYNAVISAHVKGHQWQRALHLFWILEAKPPSSELSPASRALPRPTVVTFSAAISACDRWWQALQLLTLMFARALSPTTVTFNAAIAAAEKAQEWQVALLLLADMLKQQVLPSVVSFSSAVSACEKSLRWEMALRLMDWMRSESVLANQVTYNSVISACEKGQQWQQAMLSLWSMPKALVDQELRSFGAACAAGARAWRWRVALALAQRGDGMARSGAVEAAAKAMAWCWALFLCESCNGAMARSLTLEACAASGRVVQLPPLLSSLERASKMEAKERPPREAASVTAERHRRTSLKLQHEVAELWEALRQYREKAQRDCEAVVSKQDLAKEELLQAFKSRDSTRYLVALEAALEAEVEPQDIPCVYSLHRVSGSFEVHEIDLRRRTFSAQLCFILDYTSSMKTQVQEVKSAVPRIIEAVRQLHLPLTPNARVDLEMSCVAYNDWDEDTFRLGRPVVAIFQGQEIRHAHGEPLLREEDFNLGGEFTRKAEALEAWIDQGLGHGGFVPEELTGALLAASYLPWNAENESEPSACAKLAVVITDAPCHGKAYSAVAHDVFCDRSTGLTCSGCPEVPLRRLREQGVQVAIFHTGEGPAVSMCEKLCASEPDLIHEKVDPSATAQKLVNLLEGKLKLQPLSYVLKTFSLGQPETPHLDLALAHDMEVEDGDGQKERYKIGLDGLLFLGFPERNPKVVVRRPLDSKLDPLYERRSELVELPRVYAGCGCHELRMWPLRGEG